MSSKHLETRIIFEASPDSHGWLERQLVPWGGLTNILTEHFFWGDHHKLPEPGYRPTIHESQDGTGQSTHYSPGDWVVDRVVYYPRPNDDEPAIAICYCEYSPIERDWKPLGMGRPIPELLAEMDKVQSAVEKDAADAIAAIEPDPVLVLSGGREVVTVRLADIVEVGGEYLGGVRQDLNYVGVRNGGEVCRYIATEEEYQIALQEILSRKKADATAE